MTVQSGRIERIAYQFVVSQHIPQIPFVDKKTSYLILYVNSATQPYSLRLPPFPKFYTFDIVLSFPFISIRFPYVKKKKKKRAMNLLDLLLLSIGASIALVGGTTTLLTFSDSNCTSFIESLEGEDGFPSGECMNFKDQSASSYSSFMVNTLDSGCSSMLDFSFSSYELE